MKVNHERQGGWIASFVLVGAVLVLGLLGGVYYLKVRTDQAAATPNSEPVAVQGDEGDKNKPEGSDERNETDKEPASEPEDNSPESNTDTEDEDSGAVLPSGGQSSTGSTDDTNTTTLPQTGPAENLLTIGLLAVVAFAGAVYVQSRKAAE